MVRSGIIAVGLGVVCLGLAGCQSGSEPEVRVDKIALVDWVKPEDGKTYLVAMPTWRVEGQLPVVEVWGSGTLTGNKGSVDFKNEEAPLYRGAALDPGSGINPTNIPGDGIVVGVKEEVLAATGEGPKAEIYLMGKDALTPDEDLKKDMDKP